MKIFAKKQVRGRLALPGDKSISHRAAIIASMAQGVSRLSNFSTSQDCASTLTCMELLGARITREQSLISIEGRPTLIQPTRALDCGNSGTTMRVLSGVLASQELTCQLIGDDSLSQRPMRRIIDPLENMGASITSQDGRPPLIISGSSKLKPIDYRLPVASAQVKSAILFAALHTQGRTTVVERIKSRDHTERLFNGFGVSVETSINEGSESAVSLVGPASFTAGDMKIPGDISSAAYFIAAAMLLPGSQLTIADLGLNPTRAEFLEVLRAAGADIRIENPSVERNEPMGTLVVNGGFSSGGESRPLRIGGASIPSLIDELPLLAVIGSQLNGGIEITDAEELRHKETDRLKATAHNLALMGADVQEFDSGLKVGGPTKLRGARIDSFGDHRIAMSFSVASLLAKGPSEIAGAGCVGISFPEFFDILERVTGD